MIRVYIGKLLVVCDDVADLDAIVRRYGGGTAPCVVEEDPCPLHADPPVVVPEKTLATTEVRDEAGRFAVAPPHAGAPQAAEAGTVRRYETSADADRQLLAALIKAGHHGVEAGDLRRLLGGVRGRAVSGAIRGFSFRVGLRPFEIIGGPKIANKRHWRLTEEALDRLGDATRQRLPDSVGLTRADLVEQYIHQQPGGVRTVEVARAVQLTIQAANRTLMHLETQGRVQRHGIRFKTLWTLPGATPTRRIDTIDAAIVQVLEDARGAQVDGAVLRDAVTTMLEETLEKKPSAASIATALYKLVQKKEIVREGANENGPMYRTATTTEHEGEGEDADDARILN